MSNEISDVVSVKYAVVGASLPSIPASAPVVWSAAGTAQNEIQTITVDATGGTFTISYGGQTTATIAFGALGETVESKLEALSSIGEGQVSVTGASGGPFVITFRDSLGNQDIAAVTTDPALLTGGAGTAAVVPTQAGAEGGSTWTDVPNVDPEKGVKIAIASSVRDIFSLGSARPTSRHVLSTAVAGITMSFTQCGESALSFLYPDWDLTDHVLSTRAKGTEANYIALAVETSEFLLELIKVSPNAESELLFLNSDIAEPELSLDTFEIAKVVGYLHFWGA